MKYFKSFSKISRKRENKQLLLEYRSSLESIDAGLTDLENMTAPTNTNFGNPNAHKEMTQLFLEWRKSSDSLEDDPQDMELAEKLEGLNNRKTRSQMLLEYRPSNRTRSRWSSRKLSLRRLSEILESCKACGTVARRACRAMRRIIRRVKMVAAWSARYGFMFTDLPGFELLLARIYMEVFARIPGGWYWEWGPGFEEEYEFDLETSSSLSMSSCGSWSSFMHRSDSDTRPPPPPSGNLYMNDGFEYEPFDDHLLEKDHAFAEESFELPQDKFVKKSVSMTTKMGRK